MDEAEKELQIALNEWKNAGGSVEDVTNAIKDFALASVTDAVRSRPDPDQLF